MFPSEMIAVNPFRASLGAIGLKAEQYSAKNQEHRPVVYVSAVKELHTAETIGHFGDVIDNKTHELWQDDTVLTIRSLE